MNSQIKRLRKEQNQMFKIFKKSLAEHDRLKKIIASNAKFDKIEEACIQLIFTQNELATASALLDMIEEQLPKKFRTK